MTIRVVIADDQGMVRAGFRSLLAHESDIEVVGEAADGQAAVAIVRHTRPDVVLMDIRMPVLDGLAATRRLMAEPQPPRVLALTTFDLDQYVYEALRAGAAGFLLKDATVEDLVAAIRTLAAGNAILDPAVTRRVIEAFVRSKPPDPSATAKLDRLTEREVQVLRLIARGLSNAELARRLVVTDATAKTHVSNVLTKLDLRDRVQGVIYAYETGLVQPGADV
jgi:DNA-binding NarL/FixJ family response regulator